MSVAESRKEPYVVALVVTALILVVTRFLPESMQGALVGALFLGTTWIFVWRRSDEVVESHGLALGGLIFPGPIDRSRLARDTKRAVGYAALAALVTFVPYYFGFRFLAKGASPFVFPFDWKSGSNEVLGQFLLVALPEEAFYRGYLQTELDRGTRKWNVLGAEVGAGLFLASAIFALGHLSSRHGAERLLVFFPALLFGWLRVRTKGIGAGLTYHALCNLFSVLLFRGFHVAYLSLG